ncbi:hypothetical protein V1517DRAFT_349146 [Lipomyces orientalis]|uniref:Uncharacterized protein n=1 Tax=Lipomyces orientalis TaxID=1233043 RepID=A0ACC3TES0_9ASCO
MSSHQAGPKNILILGASRGIGLGLVQKSLSAYPSATVYATIRSSKTASGLQSLADQNPERLVVLEADVTNEKSVAELRDRIARRTSSLDQVIYNAGVLIGWAAVTKVGLEALKQSIEVNVYGAYTAATTFSPFVERSDYPNRVFVLLGSSFGSITTAKENFDFHNAAFGTEGVNNTAVYDISKTAEARLAIEFDLELRPRGVPFLLAHPGLPKTDMNALGTISVDTSTDGLVNVIGAYSADRKERFLDYSGEEVPW